MKNNWKGPDWDSLTEEERNERFYSRNTNWLECVCEAVLFVAIFALALLACFVID